MKSIFFSKEKLPPKAKNSELLQSLVSDFGLYGFLLVLVNLHITPFKMMTSRASYVILLALFKPSLAQSRMLSLAI